MQLLEKYITEMEQDLRVDAFNIKEVQLRLPAIKHKWVGRFVRHKMELMSLHKSRDLKKKELVLKVIEQSPVKITEYTAEKTAESTTTLKEIDEKVNEIKLIIELLEKSEKTFSSMTYDIKNMIELQKLEQL
tara:strand:- start:8835 stop:9230 length:396 start_codon:yes stop_codon:yes gene_type:complete